ncbi:16S rRNA (adenine(1518)-N(6)/adenine(1519)-N(6))-dimethyltransferase RsmA [Cytophagaceae bacterium ABcell3]|nr:16S rRNA (adenine(1518)-N(6)/adenine(1519)-N(6))-dimethyltransferase RsmA [Cytophagaceae bacterium ABcell3]
MERVRAKKHLGQHFLRDKGIAADIVAALEPQNRFKYVLEIGPGTGVLTDILVKRTDIDLSVIELDKESVAFLKENKILSPEKIIEGDFLKLDIQQLFNGPFGLIGNFPYNISSQIFFKVLENKEIVPEVVCMIQKEVAQRIASPHGNKDYGILSVLLQAFYDIKYLFTVDENVFIPPPKVKSAVIRLTRNSRETLPCDEVFFIKLVKQAFSTRRKTLRNALKPYGISAELSKDPIFDKRAEQLSVDAFIDLAVRIKQK